VGDVDSFNFNVQPSIDPGQVRDLLPAPGWRTAAAAGFGPPGVQHIWQSPRDLVRTTRQRWR